MHNVLVTVPDLQNVIGLCREAYGKIDFKLRLGFNQLFILWYLQVILSNNVLCHIDVENLQSKCEADQIDASNCSLLLAQVLATPQCESSSWTMSSLIGLTLLTVFGALWELVILFSKVRISERFT